MRGHVFNSVKKYSDLKYPVNKNRFINIKRFSFNLKLKLFYKH